MVYSSDEDPGIIYFAFNEEGCLAVYELWERIIAGFYEGYDSKERKDAILMQYSNLYDKNKKEIYENDIIFESRHTNKKYVCKFDMIYGLRFYDENGYYVMPIEPVNRPQKHIEVIGNIYENPTLMEVNK